MAPTSDGDLTTVITVPSMLGESRMHLDFQPEVAPERDVDTRNFCSYKRSEAYFDFTNKNFVQLIP